MSGGRGARFGLPMVRAWDIGGIAASVILAVGGVAIRTWGSPGATWAADADWRWSL
jgi:hypothetical protein